MMTPSTSRSTSSSQLLTNGWDVAKNGANNEKAYDKVVRFYYFEMEDQDRNKILLYFPKVKDTIVRPVILDPTTTAPSREFQI
ncbi:hypothetical protein TELCIR_25718 [Teladorsagia circumcincta]|uniref:Uncharacterized protein n=1 Tax=Teladorsagia circumcincta TaxID=45464 RepID=A0A2G9T4T3_TELCI|nr:hypothetical protein TELCIR_25718 [Teladorsagia circumcincta]